MIRTRPYPHHGLLACVCRATVTALLLLVAIGATALHAAGYDFAARAATVDALVEAGRRLDATADTAAALNAAGRLRAQAATLFRDGDEATARHRLDSAYAVARNAVQALVAKPGIVTSLLAPASEAAAPTGDARARRYDTLMASIDAFSASYRDVYAERGAGRADVSARVATLADAARREHAAGDLDRALAKAKNAYLLLQTEIVTMRGGQTLVRELHFTSDREEYDYEMGRHDTHLLLVEMLLERVRDDQATDRAVRLEVDRSMRLHWLAHKLGDGGDYRQAIARLEAASARLVALIRGHGFDIPE